MIQELIQNLRAGTDLLFFRKVKLASFHINIDQAALLIIFDLILKLITDYIEAMPDPDFDRYAVPVYGLDLTSTFLVLYVLAKWLKNNRVFLQAIVIIYSTTPLFRLFNLQLAMMQKHPGQVLHQWLDWLGYVYIIYCIAVLWHNFWLVCNPKKWTTFASLLTFIIISAMSQNLFKNNSNFWYVQEENDEEIDYYAEYRKLDVETLMYRQPNLLDGALTALKPQRKHHSDTYFVGFAPYATEDVFSKEVIFAKNLLDKNFDTQGRSINLINHLKTTENTPLATATNLGRTLNHLGKLMNTKEDVLVMYLTSHGSKKHELSVQFWPLSLNNITPAKLKAMLDAAGIKWRIIIISACYSGGYIKLLQNPTTVIATASAADKTSFGCGSQSEFTYFGEAVFKNQLKQKTSFVNALKGAVIEIGEREKNEKKEPSNPQLSIGSEIMLKLEKSNYSNTTGKLVNIPPVHIKAM